MALAMSRGTVSERRQFSEHVKSGDTMPKQSGGFPPDCFQPIPRPSVFGAAGRLEQEPGPPLGLVDEILEQTGGRDVLIFVGKLMAFAHRSCDMLVVVHQLTQHLFCR